MKCIFENITERDIDILFMEEMIAEQKFANIFLNRIGKSDATVIEVEHSKTDVVLGESDITIIVDWNGERHALLIENKIDAIAMEKQCERYFERGKKGIAQNEYKNFDVFIVAPQKYLDENQESKKYPYRISYEEICNYFSKGKSARSLFKKRQLEQAIENQRRGYQVQENIIVTEFWNHYIDYQEKYYPNLYLKSKKEPKGSKAKWAHYSIKSWSISHQLYHKMEKGFVDLTINGGAKYIIELETMLKNDIPHEMRNGITVVPTGKSACFRVKVPILNVFDSFEMQEDQAKECFEGIEIMNRLACFLDDRKIEKLMK